MAVTVITDVKHGGNQKKDAGVTTGNEFIYKVDPTKEVLGQGLATSTGDAALYYSIDPTTPTDFDDLNISSLGALTDAVGEELPKGVEWVGIKVTSGTWTNYIKEV